MSQPKKPTGAAQKAPQARPTSGKPAPGKSQSATSQSRPKGSTASRPPTKRPVAAQQTGFRASIDRTLPPYTTRRYVAIWIAGLIPLVLVLLVLTQCNGLNSSSSAQVTPTAVGAASGAAASQPTATAAGQAGAASTPASGAASSAPTSAPAAAASPAASGNKYMVIDTAKGTIVAQLYTQADANVSKTIANFEQKANSGYFNGLTFHRVEDWVIQGGDPLGNGTGGGQMPSEYNKLPFKRGALGVARGGDAAINNDSQFFIVKTDADYLDGQYTNFGQVIQGMDVVDKIVIGDKMTKVTVQDHP